jgi:Tfp pilus assembly protein PilO
MKVNEKFFHELSKKKYLAYLHSLPDFRQEQTQTYLTIALTIFAFSFFGLFAISPTLSTIGELRKQIDDSKYIDQQLQNKISSMTALENQYGQLSPQIPLLLQAIPATPDVPTLIGQIRALGSENNVDITQVSTDMVQLASQTKTSPKLQTYAVTISASGDYTQLSSFYQSLVHFKRLLILDSLTLIRQQDTTGLKLTVRALTYFKP